MLLAALRVLQIKDLKDLRALLCRRDTIDMQDLKDLKRHSFTVARGPAPRGGQAHALRARKRSASPCARSGSGEPELQSLKHAGDRGGQAPALRN